MIQIAEHATQRVAALQALGCEPLGLAFSADGGALAVALADGGVRVWGTAKWRQVGAQERRRLQPRQLQVADRNSSPRHALFPSCSPGLGGLRRGPQRRRFCRGVQPRRPGAAQRGLGLAAAGVERAGCAGAAGYVERVRKLRTELGGVVSYGGQMPGVRWRMGEGGRTGAWRAHGLWTELAWMS